MIFRYVSELRLVRVHGYEGGIYTLKASHNDDSVNHSFSVHVICKFWLQIQDVGLHIFTTHTQAHAHVHRYARTQTDTQEHTDTDTGTWVTSILLTIT